MTTSSIALTIEAVSLGFGGVTALAGIDLSVAKGEIRAIIGPNGAGKTSLLNVISGIYRPDHGRIWVSGRGFTEIRPQALAGLGIARSFQNLALFKSLSVLDNVVTGLAHRLRWGVLAQILGLPAARREQDRNYRAALAMLEFLGLDHLRDQPAGTLSYGTQKRVELARALVSQPEILLLDEPMAGMTLTDKQVLTGLIRAARDRYGTSILLIEHDVGVVMGLSDRIAVLDYGRKIADGTPDEIRVNPVVIDAYLGVAHDQEAGAGI